MALMILGRSDECLATPFLSPVPDCWENMCHELIVKQLLSRKQPGAVRQNMLNNRKTLFFLFLVWSSDTRTFSTRVRLTLSPGPSDLHFRLQEACICSASADLTPQYQTFTGVSASVA